MFNDKSRLRNVILLIVLAALIFSLVLAPNSLFSVLGYVLTVLADILAGFALAFILNLLVYPVESLISRPLKKIGRRKREKKRTSRVLAIIISFACALSLVALVVMSIWPSMQKIIERISQGLPDVIDRIPDLSENLAETLHLNARYTEKLSELLNNIVNSLMGFLSNIPAFAVRFTGNVFGGIADVILSLAVCIYALSIKEQLTRWVGLLLSAYVPERPRGVLYDIRELMYDKFSLFFRGQLIEAVILGVLCLGGMFLFRFPNAGALSVLMGVTAIVPVLGPWIGSLTSILLMLITDPSKAMWFALFILTLQQIEDNLIYPRVVGRTMGVPGLVVLCAVIVGAEVDGMIGIILAVPLSAVIYELIKKDAVSRIKRKISDAPAEAENSDGADENKRA